MAIRRFDIPQETFPGLELPEQPQPEVLGGPTLPEGVVPLHPSPETSSTDAVAENTPADLPNLNKPRAFGAVPNLLKLTADHSIEVGEQDYARLRPVSLREALWHNTVGPADTSPVVDGVALRPEEYTKIVRYVPGLLRVVGAKTAGAHELAEPVRQQEAVLEAQRGAMTTHGIESARIARALDVKASHMDTLLRYIKQPGHAMTTEANLRQLAVEAWMEFDRIIEIAGRQMNLDPAQQVRLQQALIRSLSTGAQSERIRTWGEMTRLAKQYADRRKVLFENRSQQCVGKAAELSQELVAFREKHGLTER